MKFFFGGGLNENQAPHLSEAAKGSKNFLLQKDSSRLSPRLPFDLKGTADNAADIRGILQLIKRDDSATTLVQAGDTVYLWDGASDFTSTGTVTATSKLRDVYWSLGDYLVITDIAKTTVVKKWDGSTLGTLTTGLGTDLYARYGLVHHNRVWLFNVKTTSDTPHLMVASAFENPESYSTSLRAVDTAVSTGNEAFYMLAPDLRPINGAALINKELLISTEGGALFRLTGTSALDYAWVSYYPASNAVGTESMVNTGNDVMYMKRGGGIELMIPNQESSDISANDVSRVISDTVEGLSDAIAVYDQTRQRVLFFISGKVLVFFKDIYYGGALADDKGTYLKLSPWSVFTTLDAAAFTTACAKYLRIPGTTTYSVYFGATDGRVFDLNGSGVNGDAGASTIHVVLAKRTVDERDGFNGTRKISKGTVTYRRINQIELSIEQDFADEYSVSTATVVLKGPLPSDDALYFGDTNYFGEAIYFGQGFQYETRVSHVNFSNVGKGPGCFLTLSTQETVDYQIDSVEL